MYTPLVTSFHEVVKICGHEFTESISEQLCWLLICENETVLKNLLPNYTKILRSLEIK